MRCTYGFILGAFLALFLHCAHAHASEDTDYNGDSDTEEEDSDSNPGQGNGPPSSNSSAEASANADAEASAYYEGNVSATGGNTTVVIEDEPNIFVPSAKGSSTGCDTSGASVGIKAGGFALSFPTYPCEVARTHEALDHAYAVDPNTGVRKHGFVTGTLPGFFLKVRLITKGIFSAIAGLIGLG